MATLQDRKDAYTASREVLGTVVTKLLTLPQKPVFNPADISKTISEVLARFDRRAHLRYVAEHPSQQK
jgi:hypothetical protein